MSANRGKREAGSGKRFLSSRAQRGISAVALLTLSGCAWFTDFKKQPKIDPWESVNDSIPPRGNPQNSVSIYGSAAPGLLYDRAPTPQAIASMSGLVNPIAADSASVNRGRKQYQINCAVCHGPSGMANGSAVKYGMPGIAIGAGSRAANELSDGYIFAMIRNGRGLMPSYNRIEDEGRWDIVNYLRSLQGKNSIPADTTHGLPGVTGSAVPGASVSAPTRPAPFVKPAATAAGAPTAGDTTKVPPTDSTTRRPPEHKP